MTGLFGDGIAALPYFGFGTFDVLGTRQVIARSGYSKQGGFEIYLEGGHLGGALWDLVWEAGRGLEIRPGCPNLIERIEGGLMSYGNEFTRANNPLECGFKRYCHLEDGIDYIGREALLKIAEDGPDRHIMGVKFGGEPLSGVAVPLAVMAADGTQVGQVTSGIWSPRLGCNVGMSMIARDHWDAGTAVIVRDADGAPHEGVVASLPL
ncbi:MAG: glycine cleavage T C-terminal barrel domain-containing protein, partial [Pseudomonadota bacterium]|nr:glycine cleavage T C-terminal barrel domain-containing protein [Pseudomonadota bacterium]MEC7853605.1 glycine cleavage T C-terminal barrel domain-containing protein [Pseudomonadota bacterium]